MSKDYLSKVKEEFKEIVKSIDGELGKDYASKNPALVQYLLGNIQQSEDRDTTKEIHKVSDK